MVLDFTGQELRGGDIIIIPFTLPHSAYSLALGVITGFGVDFVEVRIHMPDEPPIDLLSYGHDLVKTGMLEDTTNLVNMASMPSNVRRMANLKLKGLLDG